MDTVDTDCVIFAPDKGVLKRRRIWYVLAVGLSVLSFFVQQPHVFLAGLLVLLIGLLPELWYRASLRHLVVHCTANQHRLFFGEEITLAMSIDNQKWLPLPWLRTENTISPPHIVQFLQSEQTQQTT
jgi:hypothetical protein